MIETLTDEKLQPAYAILCQSLLSSKTGRRPFSPTYCLIEPHQATSPHSHHEVESFFILEGQGTLVMDQKEHPVSGGDIVLIPPFSTHQLTNDSATSPLKFISVYSAEASIEPLPDKALILAAPPTPNGPLHLGHISGPYLAADILKRYLDLRAVPSRIDTGTDDHQSYVKSQAQNLQQDVSTTIATYRDSAQLSFKSFNLGFDRPLFPSQDLEYQKFVGQFFERLIRTGKLLKKSTPVPFCTACNAYVIEDRAQGLCPGCHQEQTGHSCENCGLASEPHHMEQLRCASCQNTPTQKTMERFVLPLSQYTEDLQAYRQSLRAPAAVKSFIQKQIDKGLKDFAIGTVTDYGLPFDGMNLQVWAEMAAGIVYLARHHETPLSQVTLCFGRDNIYYYSLIIPALLCAAGEETPKTFVTNEFYLLEGEKFSTSRQHAIWANDIPHDQTDPMRFFLAHDRPEGHSTSFLHKSFDDFVKNSLMGPLAVIRQALSHSLDDHSIDFGQLRREEQALVQKVVQAIICCERNYHPQQFSSRRVTRELLLLLEELRAFPAHDAPARTVLASALRHWAVLAAPIAPQLSQELLQELGIKSSSLTWLKDFTFIGAQP